MLAFKSLLEKNPIKLYFYNKKTTSKNPENKIYNYLSKTFISSKTS